MPHGHTRRTILQGSVLLGGGLSGALLRRSAHAASVDRIKAPLIDELTVREITDNQHDLFLKPLNVPGLDVKRTGTPEAAQGKTLQSEWGLALHIESRRGE